MEINGRGVQDPSGLSALGWSDWFSRQAAGAPGDAFARVAAVDRERLLLVDPEGAFPGVVAGRYLHRHRSPEEMPCVGDWVAVTRGEGESIGVVHALLERRTALRRKAAGDAAEVQMIAANVDVVVVVQSCHFDFNLHRLERYLVMVADGGAEPWILLTKTDLVDPTTLEAQVAQIRAAGIAAPVLTLSNVTREGVEELRGRLVPGNTYCFVGSSGVGKSTIVNGLVGREVLETGGVSGTGEGRHTTVRRELIRLEGGALVIDNPGMREFGVMSAGEGLPGGWSAVADLASGCRFRDCTHGDEPGCAVREAVESGAMDPGHLDHYIKLKAESDFNRMSHAERRQKDKDFGRFIKSVKKELRRR
jgi:ribosome biogenesis GTPase